MLTNSKYISGSLLKLLLAITFWLSNYQINYKIIKIQAPNQRVLNWINTINLIYLNSKKNFKMSYTHEAILQRTLINCNQRHIHAIVTNLETTSKQLKKGSQSKKICIDLYSMLKYFIKSQIQNEVYPEEDYVLQNQKILKEMIDKVNCMIYGIATIFATDDITVIFPQEDHFRIQKHYESHIRQLINQLLNTQFKQQRKKREYNFFEREQNKIYELSRIIYQNIGVSIKNPFTYEEQLSFLSQIQQEQFQVSKIIMKIKVPWLNKNIFYQDPCAIQLAYFASQGYICFSWSSTCLNYVPVGTYIIGFKAQNFLPFTKQSTKVRNLREESQKSILIRKLEQQNQLLDQLKKKIVLSEHIFYSFENFMDEIQRERVFGTFFRTDQLFLTALLPFSNQLDLGEIILDQIRDGSYSMPDWMIHKVFTLYFLIELHPIVIQVSPLKYQQRSSKLNYKNKYNILYQNDMKLMTFQQKKQIIRQKGQKYLFIHKKFEIYLNKYIPKGLQNVERLSECSSPNNNPQIKQIISKKTNILSTSESNAKKQIEQYRKTGVSRNLFNNHQSINYQRISRIENQIFQMIKRAYQETIVQSDSDIDEQY